MELVSDMQCFPSKRNSTTTVFASFRDIKIRQYLTVCQAREKVRETRRDKQTGTEDFPNMKQERQASSYTASCVFHDASVLKLF
jgi:hypothetical protein